MQKLLDDGVTADLGQPWSAIAQASAALTETPNAFSAAHIEELREAGLDDADIVDVMDRCRVLQLGQMTLSCEDNEASHVRNALSYVAPPDVVDSMLESGETKTQLTAGNWYCAPHSRCSYWPVLQSWLSRLRKKPASTHPARCCSPWGSRYFVVLLNVELLTGNFARVPLPSSTAGLIRDYASNT